MRGKASGNHFVVRLNSMRDGGDGPRDGLNQEGEGRCHAPSQELAEHDAGRRRVTEEDEERVMKKGKSGISVFLGTTLLEG